MTLDPKKYDIDARLIRHACLINGRWTGADDGRTLAVTDPATAILSEPFR